MRPKGRRGEQPALKTARLTDRTLTLLKDLQQKHNFQTIDEVVYHVAKGWKTTTYERPFIAKKYSVDQIIGSISAKIDKQATSYRLEYTKPRQVSPRHSVWRHSRKF